MNGPRSGDRTTHFRFGRRFRHLGCGWTSGGVADANRGLLGRAVRRVSGRSYSADTEAAGGGGVDGAGLDADFDGALFCVLGLRSPHSSMSASPPMTREATPAGRLRKTRR